MEVVHVEKDGNFTYMRNIHLRDKFISLKANGLLSLMFSLPPEWDCTISGLAYISKEGISAIRATIKELEEAGYISRERIRNEAGQLKDMRYTIHETPKNRDPKEPPTPMSGQPTVEDPTFDQPTLENPMLENPTLDFPAQEAPTFGKPAEGNRTQLNTNRSNNQKSKKDKKTTEPSITQSSNIDQSSTGAQVQSPHIRQPWARGKTDVTVATGIPGMNRRLSVDELEEKVRDQIEYDCLLTDSNKDELDEIVSIIVEVLATNGENFVMGGMVKPAEIVMKNYLALTCEHIQYVFACFEHTRSDVRNIRQYLRASLYNAPMTMHSSTAAEVRRDFDFSSPRKKPSYPAQSFDISYCPLPY